MLLRSLYAGLILVLATSIGSTGDKGKPKPGKDENPFKTAKVGDYTSYKISTQIKDLAIDGTMKQQVTKKDDKTATVKITASVLGMNTTETSDIDLTKPFDFESVATTGSKAKAKFTKTGEGKEKIKVGGKDYECTYITGKSEADLLGMKVSSDVKIWFSKAIPLNGLVKMDTKTSLNGTNITLAVEFQEAGNEKLKD